MSAHLAHDVRQGGHARNVIEFYQTWFGEGPELAVLRMLGLFDRPADEKALEALLKPPVIHGLTESLTYLSPADWRTILARLRRSSWQAIHIIPGSSIHILSFANPLADSSRVSEPRRGRNAISGFTATTEHLRPAAE